MFIFKELTFNIEDIYNSQTPNNYGNNHRPSSVMLEKAQLEKFQEMSAWYEKYESILGQVHIFFYRTKVYFYCLWSLRLMPVIVNMTDISQSEETSIVSELASTPKSWL